MCPRRSRTLAPLWERTPAHTTPNTKYTGKHYTQIVYDCIICITILGVDDITCYYMMPHDRYNVISHDHVSHGITFCHVKPHDIILYHVIRQYFPLLSSITSCKSCSLPQRDRPWSHGWRRPRECPLPKETPNTHVIPEVCLPHNRVRNEKNYY